MDFGMPFLMELDSIERCAKLCSDLKLQFVELNLNFPQCSLKNRRLLGEIAQQYGIYFTLHLDETQDVCHVNDRVRSAYVDTVLEAIDFSKELGCPLINMHFAQGILVALPSGRVPLYEKYHSEYHRHLKDFRAACEAAGADICIAIENTEGFAPYQRRGIELLLESPLFGLCLDTGHDLVAKGADRDFYEKHGTRLIHMHAHDCKDGHPHLAFGDGDVDLHQNLLRAKAAGARVVIETKTVAALTASSAKIGDYL